MRSRIMGLVAVLACWSTLAWAGVPNTLHYSGKLDTKPGAFTGSVDMKNYDGGGAHCAFAVWVR